jgi:hypothetical protein
MTPETNLNPLNVRGFNGRLESTFGPGAASDMLNEYTDTLSRAAPLIYRLRKGDSAAQAMKEITEAQVDYSPRAFTTEERSIMKRVFPFYSFTKSQLYFLSKELLSNPGGRLRQTIRATANAQGNDPKMPDYIADTAAIPVSESEDGTKRYVTGFGLMHEDPLSFFSPPKNMLLEAASRANPLIKTPLEYMTGQSFFQRESDGGRPLSSADPSIGRTIANIGNLTGLRDSTTPVTFPFSREVEHLAANSPASRLIGAARTVTDPRKDPLTKAINFLTGNRIADVSPAAEDTALAGRIGSILKEAGGRTLSETYIPKDRLTNLPKEEREMIEKLMELKGIIAKRRKQRKQELEFAGAQ